MGVGDVVSGVAENEPRGSYCGAVSLVILPVFGSAHAVICGTRPRMLRCDIISELVALVLSMALSSVDSYCDSRDVLLRSYSWVWKYLLLLFTLQPRVVYC